MKFEVKKIDGSLSFEAEIECSDGEIYGVKLGLAIHWGYKNNKNLRNGDYRGAIFKQLGFIGSSFDGSSFDGSSFDGSRFYDSSFIGSSFDDSSFDGSSFDGSRFYDSSFIGSRFYDSSFIGSSFDGSSFDGSRFYDSRFDEKTLRYFKHDYWGILLRYRHEVPKLIESIREGKIDGSVYSGECSCLMGTIASIKGVDVDDNQFNIKDSSSPAEQWFMMIKKGDTPDTNNASKMAVEWAEEFLEMMKWKCRKRGKNLSTISVDKDMSKSLNSLKSKEKQEKTINKIVDKF